MDYRTGKSRIQDFDKPNRSRNGYDENVNNINNNL